MTFDSVSHRPQSSQFEAFPSQSESPAGNIFQKPKHKPKNHKADTNEYCEDSQIADWENEGGANPRSPRDFFRSSSMNTVSYLTAHIEAAEALIDSGDYDAAYAELEAAAERFMAYKDKINSSFNSSIARLSTPNCRTRPPHPKALPLVRLRQQITA